METMTYLEIVLLIVSCFFFVTTCVFGFKWGGAIREIVFLKAAANSRRKAQMSQ